ncbi:uncharacterized protein VP01_1225g17 [Puccinia sorghi]|uniref:DDE Tnp4 domain-containing protein n=1 Tax=Puccinia sorghi TaxID=27349 RepID=A0A0L6VPY0_9BASI|nr:uncharacterized protein VP01_1225g17 [Puccinia sorghi]
MERITKWIGACVVLHNFLLRDDSPAMDNGLIYLIPSLKRNDQPHQGARSVGKKLQHQFLSVNQLANFNHEFKYL